MVDILPTVVAALKQTGLKVYNENFKKDTELPCISYYFVDDSTQVNGDTLGYSDVTIYVKLYSNSQKQVAEYSAQIDNIMRKTGFTRIGSYDMKDNLLICRIFTYKCMTYEDFE